MNAQRQNGVAVHPGRPRLSASPASRAGLMARAGRADCTGMDIPTTAASATAFTNAQLSTSVGTAVASKVLDAQRTEGAGLLKMLSASLVSTAGVDGKGGQVDVRG